MPVTQTTATCRFRLRGLLQKASTALQKLTMASSDGSGSTSGLDAAGSGGLHGTCTHCTS